MGRVGKSEEDGESGEGSGEGEMSGESGESRERCNVQTLHH